MIPVWCYEIGNQKCKQDRRTLRVDRGRGADSTSIHEINRSLDNTDPSAKHLNETYEEICDSIEALHRTAKKMI